MSRRRSAIAGSRRATDGTKRRTGCFAVMAGKAKIQRAARVVLKADEEVASAAIDHREDPAVRAIGWVSDIGDQPQMRILSALVIGGGLLARSPRLIRAGVRMLIAHEAATFAKDQVKARVDRTRPRSAGTRQQRKPRQGAHLTKEVTSFPSGHSAGAIAVARAFGREFPEYRAPALGAAAAVAAAQIPRCTHYGSDIAAGLLLGAAAEAVTNGVWESAADAIADGNEAR